MLPPHTDDARRVAEVLRYHVDTIRYHLARWASLFPGRNRQIVYRSAQEIMAKYFPSNMVREDWGNPIGALWAYEKKRQEQDGSLQLLLDEIRADGEVREPVRLNDITNWVIDGSHRIVVAFILDIPVPCVVDS